jgi:hypothetical protein
MLGYVQRWIETVTAEDPFPISIEFVELEITEQWCARLIHERRPLLDMQGEYYMSQSADTIGEAAALLDAQCMQDLKIPA